MQGQDTIRKDVRILRFFLLLHYALLYFVHFFGYFFYQNLAIRLKKEFGSFDLAAVSVLLRKASKINVVKIYSSGGLPRITKEY